MFSVYTFSLNQTQNVLNRDLMLNCCRKNSNRNGLLSARTLLCDFPVWMCLIGKRLHRRDDTVVVTGQLLRVCESERVPRFSSASDVQLVFPLTLDTQQQPESLRGRRSNVFLSLMNILMPSTSPCHLGTDKDGDSSNYNMMMEVLSHPGRGVFKVLYLRQLDSFQFHILLQLWLTGGQLQAFKLCVGLSLQSR